MRLAHLRAHPEIQGYVITEFTDVNWEANGLLDMWRHPKAFGEALSRLQQDDLLILRGDKRNYKAGEPVEADVYVSHYGAGDLAGAQVDWQVEGTSLCRQSAGHRPALRGRGQGGNDSLPRPRRPHARQSGFLKANLYFPINPYRRIH